MKSFCILIIFSLLLCFHTKAQTPSSQSIYAELGGAGLAYSFNYDFRFDKENLQSWGMRIGAGGWARNDTYNKEALLSLPVQINHLWGKGPHYFELGSGGTFLYYRDRNTWGDNDFIRRNFHFILDSGRTPAVMGTLNLGYRKIPVDGGVTFRANLTPIFNHNGFWPLFAGVGVGYAF